MTEIPKTINKILGGLRDLTGEDDISIGGVSEFERKRSRFGLLGDLFGSLVFQKQYELVLGEICVGNIIVEEKSSYEESWAVTSEKIFLKLYPEIHLENSQRVSNLEIGVKCLGRTGKIKTSYKMRAIPAVAELVKKKLPPTLFYDTSNWVKRFCTSGNKTWSENYKFWTSL